MKREKIIDFVNKLIQKTKDCSLAWGRCSEPLISLPIYLTGESMLKNSGFDLDKSYLCKYNSGKIYLAFKEDNVSVIIQPSISENRLHSIRVKEDDVELQSQIMRLYNIIYNLFPNIDRFVDAFLIDDQLSEDNTSSDDDALSRLEED